MEGLGGIGEDEPQLRLSFEKDLGSTPVRAREKVPASLDLSLRDKCPEPNYLAQGSLLDASMPWGPLGNYLYAPQVRGAAIRDSQ